MTLRLEFGSGSRNANSYVTTDYVSTYLGERNRATEGGWQTAAGSVKEAACIAASQYIDTTWGAMFKGSRLRTFDGVQAQAVLTFSGTTTNGDTIEIGEITYTFVSTLSTYLGKNEVLIGASAADTAARLIDAINADQNNAGVTFSEAQDMNEAVMAEVDEGTAEVVWLTSSNTGESGNNITLTATSSDITVSAAFQNGVDFGTQSLEFPRDYLYDRKGNLVEGIPEKLKQATAEYAVRSIASDLQPDPVVDDTGQNVISNMEKVGPLETEVKYSGAGGIVHLSRPYPAADSLLAEYTFPKRVSFK